MYLSLLEDPRLSAASATAEPTHRQSPYRRASEPSAQPTSSHTQKHQRQKSSDSNPSDVLQRLSRDYETNKRRYSASDESEDSTQYQMPNNLSSQELPDVSPWQLSQDVEEERDVDMPYVIGQFKLENKLHSKPFFLNRASTFSVKSREKLPKKSNLKRAVSSSPKHSRSARSVIYEEIAL